MIHLKGRILKYDFLYEGKYTRRLVLIALTDYLDYFEAFILLDTLPGKPNNDIIPKKKNDYFNRPGGTARVEFLT